MQSYAIAGDETGLLKLVDLDKGTYKAYGHQSRARSIIGLHWEQYGTSIRLIRNDGTIQTWKMTDENDDLYLHNEYHTNIINQSNTSSHSGLNNIVKFCPCGPPSTKTKEFFMYQ